MSPTTSGGFPDWNPQRDLPSMEGKVIFITGGTAGLGAQSILELARHSPAHIYFSGRDAAKAADLTRKVHEQSPGVAMTFVEMDFSSLESVKKATLAISSSFPRLDILMCNAGVMATPPGLSKDGFEIQFAINHLAHAMLTSVLLPVLLRTAESPGADVRIVVLTSEGYRGGPKGGVNYDTVRTTQDSMFLGSWFRYSQSKMANVLFARELARRFPSIMTVVVHPGVVNTGLVSDLSFRKKMMVYVPNYLMGVDILPLEKGPYSQLWCCGVKRELLKRGAYYKPIGLETPLLKKAMDEKDAIKLWDWTEEVVSKY